MLKLKEISKSIKEEMTEIIFQTNKAGFSATGYKISNGIILHFQYFDEVAKFYKMDESFCFCDYSENAEKLLSEELNNKLLEIYNNFLTVTTQDEFNQLVNTIIYSIDNDLNKSDNLNQPLIHFYKNDENGFFGVEDQFENQYYLTNNKKIFNSLLEYNNLEII